MEEKTPDNEYCVDTIIGEDYSPVWHKKTNDDIRRKIHLSEMIVRHVVDHHGITDRSQMANAWEMVAALGALIAGD